MHVDLLLISASEPEDLLILHALDNLVKNSKKKAVAIPCIIKLQTHWPALEELHDVHVMYNKGDFPPFYNLMKSENSFKLVRSEWP